MLERARVIGGQAITDGLKVEGWKASRQRFSVGEAMVVVVGVEEGNVKASLA